jgi:hypothetical protein
MPSFENVALYIGSIGSFLDEHSGAIAAISAIFVAIFTATLWRATTRLWLSANRQSAHLEETAERQLRAYVLVTTAEIISRDPRPGIRLAFKNSGQTPAYDVRIWVDVSIRTPDNERHFSPPLQDHRMGSSIIGDLILDKYLEVDLVHEEHILLAEGKITLYVWGEVTYRDAFNRQRRTRYRLRSLRSSEPGLHPCEEGNEAN